MYACALLLGPLKLFFLFCRAQRRPVCAVTGLTMHQKALLNRKWNRMDKVSRIHSTLGNTIIVFFRQEFVRRGLNKDF